MEFKGMLNTWTKIILIFRMNSLKFNLFLIAKSEIIKLNSVILLILLLKLLEAQRFYILCLDF
jgi:hypothetical protein